MTEREITFGGGHGGGKTFAAFRDAIDALKKRDARIAELEAVLRGSMHWVRCYQPLNEGDAKGHTLMLERIDAILNKGSDTNG